MTLADPRRDYLKLLASYKSSRGPPSRVCDPPRIGAAVHAMRFVVMTVFAASVACATALVAFKPVNAQCGATPPGAYFISEFEVIDPDGIRPYSASVESTFKPCNGNAGEIYGVDIHTVLSGQGFECIVTVKPGQTKRVRIVAPNSRADAEYVRTSVGPLTGAGPSSR